MAYSFAVALFAFVMFSAPAVVAQPGPGGESDMLWDDYGEEFMGPEMDRPQMGGPEMDEGGRRPDMMRGMRGSMGRPDDRMGGRMDERMDGPMSGPMGDRMGGQMSGPMDERMGGPRGFRNEGPWMDAPPQEQEGLFGDDSLFAGSPEEPLSKKAIKSIVEGKLAILRNDRLKTGDVTIINDEIAEVKIVTVDDSLVSTVGISRIEGEIIPAFMLEEMKKEAKPKK